MYLTFWSIGGYWGCTYCGAAIRYWGCCTVWL